MGPRLHRQGKNLVDDEEDLSGHDEIQYFGHGHLIITSREYRR